MCKNVETTKKCKICITSLSPVIIMLSKNFQKQSSAVNSYTKFPIGF